MATATGGAPGALPQHGRVLPAFGIIGWRWISRNPASAISPILLPFVFLYFLRLISPIALFPLEVVGAMLFTTINVGNWVLADSATWRIELGIQDLFVASPLNKMRYLFGIAFSNLIAAAPALVALAILLGFATPVSPLGWAVLVGSITVLWVLFSAIGIALSSRLGSYREVWPVGSLAFTTLGLLSPLYYPLSVLPPVWREVALFLPATYAALLIQGTLGLVPQSSVELALDGAILIALAVIGTVVAISLYRWRTSGAG